MTLQEPTSLSELAALESIRQLKYRYFRALDTGDIPALRECFAADAKGVFIGRQSKEVEGTDAIVDLISKHATQAGLVAHHFGHHPEIRLVDPATAQGIWTLADKFVDLANKLTQVGTAQYFDTYVKTPEGWKIKSTRYQRLYQETDRWGAEKEVFTPILEGPERESPQ